MSVSLVPIAALQAVLEYGIVGSSSWWVRVGSAGDRLWQWTTSHPLEVVLSVIGLLVLYKFLRP